MNTNTNTNTSSLNKLIRLIQQPARLKQVIKWRTWDRVARYLERQRVDRSVRLLQSKTAAQYDQIRCEVLARTAQVSREEITRYVEEFASDHEFQQAFERKLAETRQIDAESTTSTIDVKTLYTLVRAAKPSIVVETGVYFGGTSAFLLRALQRNGEHNTIGRLHSIDFLIPGVQPYGHPLGQGCLVPAALRNDWQLINGDSRVELPRLLAQLGPIDLFLHDSLHTHAHMTWEYEMAWAALRSGGFLATHDATLTHAFRDFSRKHQAQSTGGVVCDVGVLRKH